MGGVEVSSWFGDVRSRPAVIVEAETAEEIAAVLRDRERYPNPVRAAGSNHAATACAAAAGGTLIEMRRMDRVLEIGDGGVTAQAGARSRDVARELRGHGLQLHVNPELGDLTIGAAACTGARDSSMPGESGQTASYATSIKLITPAGDLVEITESEPELLRLARSSHGLLGIVYEATFRVRPQVPMRVRHERHRLADLERVLPAVRELGESITLYLDPFTDTLLVELRAYQEDLAGHRVAAGPWPLRNAIWGRWAPGAGHLVRRVVPAGPARHVLTDVASRLTVRAATAAVRGDRTAAAAQQAAGGAASTFSTWAFPEGRYVECARRYVELARRHQREHGYRPDLLTAGRRLEADQASLLSQSFDGPVITIDPASTGGAGWDDFLRAYNELCAELGGVPLLDQTSLLTRAHVDRAFGERIARFAVVRGRYDPADRLLNPFFEELLAAAPPPAIAVST